jgi:hypothetical protein
MRTNAYKKWVWLKCFNMRTSACQSCSTLVKWVFPLLSIKCLSQRIRELNSMIGEYALLSTLYHTTPSHLSMSTASPFTSAEPPFPPTWTTSSPSLLEALQVDWPQWSTPRNSYCSHIYTWELNNVSLEFIMHFPLAFPFLVEHSSNILST